MDIYYMEQALQIARYAKGRTSPNPMVGALIVREGRVIAQGWHRKAGTPHAEIHALRQAGDLAQGATLYVTLEPCSHYGRTGPCTDAIIQAGIRRVVVAMSDPNPLVAGKGIERLRNAGIEVIEGILSKEAAKLNEVFIKWISTKLPFVTVKAAMSLDGKIAAHTGHSKWITGAEAREYVHCLRDCYDSILVGSGTLLTDNPHLTTRLPEGGKNPLRIVLDSHARTPVNANVLSDGLAPTLIVVTELASEKSIEKIRQCGVQVIQIESKNGKVDLRKLFSHLAQEGITSILVEGGATINAALFKEGLVDKVHWFVAPKIIGGVNAVGPVGGQGVDNVNEAVLLDEIFIICVHTQSGGARCLPDLWKNWVKLRASRMGKILCG